MPPLLLILAGLLAVGAVYYVSKSASGSTDTTGGLPQILFTGSGSVPLMNLGPSVPSTTTTAVGSDPVAASASVAKTQIRQTGATAQMATSASLFAGLTDQLSKNGLSRIAGMFGTFGGSPGGGYANQSFLDFSVFKDPAAAIVPNPVVPVAQTNTVVPAAGGGSFSSSDWWNYPLQVGEGAGQGGDSGSGPGSGNAGDSGSSGTGDSGAAGDGAGGAGGDGSGY